jgi:hypothetical protein
MGSELYIYRNLPQGPTFVVREVALPRYLSCQLSRGKNGLRGPKGVYIRGNGPSDWRLGVGRTSSDLALETAFCYEILNKCDLSEKRKTHNGL